jgi:hypothetical protein
MNCKLFLSLYWRKISFVPSPMASTQIRPWFTWKGVVRARGRAIVRFATYAWSRGEVHRLENERFLDGGEVPVFRVGHVCYPPLLFRVTMTIFRRKTIPSPLIRRDNSRIRPVFGGGRVSNYFRSYRKSEYGTHIYYTLETVCTPYRYASTTNISPGKMVPGTIVGDLERVGGDRVKLLFLNNKIIKIYNKRTVNTR